MTRHSMLAGLAALALVVPACGRADSSSVTAAEPPPPLIEPELAPGSRLVDPRADELVRQMSDRLGRATAFALEAEEVYDEVPEQSPRRQLTNVRHVAMRRPESAGRRCVRRCDEPVVLVRRQGVLGVRPGTERLGRGRSAGDGGRGPRLGVRSDRHRHSARRLPLRRCVRPLDGGRAAWRLPGHPRGRRRAVPPPVVRAGHHRLAAVDRRRSGAAAAQAGDHLQDRGRGPAVHASPSASGTSRRSCPMCCSRSRRPRAPRASTSSHLAGRSPRQEARDDTINSQR